MSRLNEMPARGLGLAVTVSLTALLAAASDTWAGHLDPTGVVAGFSPLNSCTNLRLDTPNPGGNVKPPGTMAGYPALQQYSTELCESYALSAYMDAFRRRHELQANPGVAPAWGSNTAAPFALAACSKSNDKLTAVGDLGLVSSRYPDIIAGMKKLGGTCNLRKMSKGQDTFADQLVKDQYQKTIFGEMGTAYGNVFRAKDKAEHDELVAKGSHDIACAMLKYSMPVPDLDAKAKEIAAILTNAKSAEVDDKLGFVCDLMMQNCKSAGAFTPLSPVPDMVSATSDGKNVPLVVDLQLSRGLPIPFAVTKKDLFGPEAGSDGHAMLITGREWINGKCRYLVHDSNGTDCNVYTNPKIADNCGSKPEGHAAGAGNFWVDEDTLSNAATGYFYSAAE